MPLGRSVGGETLDILDLRPDRPPICRKPAVSNVASIALPSCRKYKGGVVQGLYSFYQHVLIDVSEPVIERP
jgi:hypothetical protein